MTLTTPSEARKSARKQARRLSLVRFEFGFEEVEFELKLQLDIGCEVLVP